MVAFTAADWLVARTGWQLGPLIVAVCLAWGVASCLVLVLRRWQGGERMSATWDVLGFGAVAVDDLVYLDGYPAPDSKMPVVERSSVRVAGWPARRWS